MSVETILTQAKLAKLIPRNAYVPHWHAALMQCLPDYEITTAPRIASFIAQCSHESAKFTAISENLNYKWESLMRVFPKYFPTKEMAQKYAHNQPAIANRVYANRMGNGPESSGDGFKYKGRGLIQLTGKNNYQLFATSIDTPLEEVTEFLSTFEGAVQSACWFWETNNLNQYADSGDIVTMSKRINGGTIGLEERMTNYKTARMILG